MGKFEAANGGTIYIPEISCLTEVVQLKLLYFMQYKRISRVGQDPHKPEINLSVRVIVATNDDLEGLVESGRIREDFYHRIAGVQLRIPPLRERIDDVLPLAEYFLETFSGAPRGVRFDFSPQVADLLRSYHWPGNVRQLENAVKGAIAFSNGSILGPREFAHSVRLTKHPGGNSNSDTHNQTMPLVFDQAENLFKHEYFRQLMAAADHSVPRAAALSGLTPQWIRKMIKWLGIHKSPGTFPALFVFVETLVS
jgi:DNA-binding NtrC family response regulator